MKGFTSIGLKVIIEDRKRGVFYKKEVNPIIASFNINEFTPDELRLVADHMEKNEIQSN